MQNTVVNGGSGRVLAEDVISKLKDDGDFDRLRLKIIRKLKENEELRSSIISMVKQSGALNRPGAENMKPRQLSEAIHQEIGDKVMSQISDDVWKVIKSGDGMKKEITETVESVYNKLSNPPIREEDNGDPSSSENIGEAAAVAMGGALSDGDPNVPPGFSMPMDIPQNTTTTTYDGFPCVRDAIAEDDDPDVPPGFG